MRQLFRFFRQRSPTIARYEPFLQQARALLHHLDSQIDLDAQHAAAIGAQLGLDPEQLAAVALGAQDRFAADRRGKCAEIIERTQQAIQGVLSEADWRTAVRGFLIVELTPLEQVLQNGLQRHFESLAVEPVCTADIWQTYLSLDPARARRRYCHQVKLVMASSPWLRQAQRLSPSVAQFQKLARRQPEHFLPQAQTLAQQCNDPHLWAEPEQPDKIAEIERLGSLLGLTELKPWQRQLFALDQTSPKHAEALWQQVSDQPYTATTPYTAFAGPQALFQAAIRQLTAHYWQLQRRAGNQPHALEQAERQPPTHALAVAIEEAHIPDPPAVAPTPQAQSQFAPFPDEAAWRQLIEADTPAAQRRYTELQLLMASLGATQLPFNVGESIAACKTVAMELQIQGMWNSYP